jgi:hypothetical protein
MDGTLNIVIDAVEMVYSAVAGTFLVSLSSPAK